MWDQLDMTVDNYWNISWTVPNEKALRIISIPFHRQLDIGPNKGDNKIMLLVMMYVDQSYLKIVIRSFTNTKIEST